MIEALSVSAIIIMILCVLVQIGRRERTYPCAEWQPFTLQDLTVETSAFYEAEIMPLPIYLGAVQGVQPAIGWYTARIDGQRVLVLESEDRTC